MEENNIKLAATLKNVYFTYNKGKTNEYKALDNVSLDIFFEQFVIIFGPSGCGKSTLLNIIAGLETPDEGIVSVLNRDLMNLKRDDFAKFHRTEMGMIYQQYNLIPSLSVLDNVALPQVFINISRSKRNAWAKTLLERFGIAKHEKKIPTELSGGQQQRIGIARSIVNNPKMILADEPMGNLDSKSAENVLDILMELNEKEKKTIVMVTHNPEQLYVADRIIYMKDGVIIKEEENREKGIRKQQNQTTSGGMARKAPTATISSLMRAYHGLAPEQINILIMPYKAKVFVHHFITDKTLEETSVFEDVVQRRLLGTITEQEFEDVLKRESRNGGVGLNIRTAKKIIKRVNSSLGMAHYINQKYRQGKNDQGEHDLINDDEKTEKVFSYLLNTCYKEHYKNLNEEQIVRLKRSIKNRLTGVWQRNDFFDFLDDSMKTGGVGLNSKTANSITEEMELILVLAFGMGQAKRKPIIKKIENIEKEEEKIIDPVKTVMSKPAISDENELEKKAEEIRRKAMSPK